MSHTRRRPRRALARGICGLALIALVTAGCARDSAGLGAPKASVGAKLGGLLPGRKAAAAPAEAAPAPAPDLAQAALASIPGPVVLASFEANGAQMVFGLVGENGAMRSYQSPDQRGLVLRAGLLAATRGLGNDLMSSDTAAVSALIHARRPGTAERVQRYLDGSGIERPVPMRCTVALGAEVSQPIGAITYSGQQVAEHCEGSGAVIDNVYIVSPEGRIVMSRQWLGPELGYVTIQVLRG